MIRPPATAHQNNFDLIRLLAAIQVVIGHAREHLAIESPVIDAAWYLLQFFPGVPIFFVVSGFLISLSFEQNSNIVDYGWNRLLRIFPALWVCFLVSVASVVFARYEVHFRGAFWLWAASQILALPIYNPDFLRDYGVGVLNGSLWTIPVELQFYVAVPVVYRLLDLRKRRRTVVLVLSTVALFGIRQVIIASTNVDSRIAGKILLVTFVPYLCMFFLGMILQRHSDQLKRVVVGQALWWLFGYAACVFVMHRLGATCAGNNVNCVNVLVLAGLTISSAYTRPSLSTSLLRSNDVSYGMYIYHMPVVNFLRHFRFLGSWKPLAITVIVTFVLSLASWLIVERPALRFKRRPIRHH